MKKLFLPVAGLAVAALALSACSSSNGADAGTNASGQTLNVWIMQGTNPDATAFFDDVSKAFTEKTGAKLNVEDRRPSHEHPVFGRHARHRHRRGGC